MALVSIIDPFKLTIYLYIALHKTYWFKYLPVLITRATKWVLQGPVHSMDYIINKEKFVFKLVRLYATFITRRFWLRNNSTQQSLTIAIIHVALTVTRGYILDDRHQLPLAEDSLTCQFCEFQDILSLMCYFTVEFEVNDAIWHLWIYPDCSWVP